MRNILISNVKMNNRILQNDSNLQLQQTTDLQTFLFKMEIKMCPDSCPTFYITLCFYDNIDFHWNYAFLTF